MPIPIKSTSLPFVVTDLMSARMVSCISEHCNIYWTKSCYTVRLQSISLPVIIYRFYTIHSSFINYIKLITRYFINRTFYSTTILQCRCRLCVINLNIPASNVFNNYIEVPTDNWRPYNNCNVVNFN